MVRQVNMLLDAGIVVTNKLINEPVKISSQLAFTQSNLYYLIWQQ